MELYDLVSDPAEAKNLAGDPTAQAARTDLLARLRKWLDRTEDPAREWRNLAPELAEAVRDPPSNADTWGNALLRPTPRE